MNLSPRQKKLLKYLLDKSGWAKGKEIALVLGVSDRTVRNDVKELNSLVKDSNFILSSKRDGYLLKDIQTAIELLREDKNGDMVDYPDARVNYILKRLIFNRHGVDIMDLAEELKVSESTVLNDIKVAEGFLKKKEP
jgi:lichenan operon transcriptional antiterminator